MDDGEKKKLMDEYKELANQMKAQANAAGNLTYYYYYDVCPHCGHCPHCGRGGRYGYPCVPYYLNGPNCSSQTALNQMACTTMF